MTDTAAQVGDPEVVVIDDEPKGADRQLVSDLESDGIRAVLVHPDDVTKDLLRAASVIAIDHYLNVWPQRDLEPVGRQVMDGIALCSVLRSVIEPPDPAESPRNHVAYVVRTNQLDRLRGSLPAEMSQHLLAAHYGLDWVQSKVDASEGRLEVERLAALSRAVSALPSDWHAVAPSESEELAVWLGVEAAAFRAAALQQIEDCHPTAHRLAQQTGGSGFLRWFLHRVLPYPTFLLGDVRAAAAIGVTVDALRALADSSGEDSGLLNSALYRGHLATFLGRRWWLAGLEALAVRLRSEPSALGEALRTAGFDPTAHTLSTRGLVVVLDESLEPKEVPVPLQQAVRIQPDAWPAFAADAWASVDDARNDSELRAIVVAADRERLGNGA